MDIQDMTIFERVAAVQNLSAVGLELGLTPGTISKRLQALEEELSVRLFDRTTRSIRITAEGKTFLAHVERILHELDTARATMADTAGKPKGPLRIAAPASLGRRMIAPALLDFLPIYSDIEIHVDLADHTVNLQEDGYDVAIHVGSLTDSSIRAKRLAADRSMIVASPSYLAEHGRPTTPADLTGHCCLIASERDNWLLRKDGTENLVRVSGRLRSASTTVLRTAAISGRGILCTSELQVLDELQSGELCPILEDYEIAGDVGLWALYPSGKHVLPRLRVLLDFLADWFREARSNALGEAPLRFSAVDRAAAADRLTVKV
jgi:DNA-binding transcriptional LysR family regulator